MNTQVTFIGFKQNLVKLSVLYFSPLRDIIYVVHFYLDISETAYLYIFLNDTSLTNSFLGEWKIETPKGFAIADAHVNLESIDNFAIHVNLDSDKLKHRKIFAEIANNPTAKTGRRIIITVTSDGKNIVTGRYVASRT